MEILTLSEQAKSFQPGFYQHYKGPEYAALRVVHHSETLEELVLYKHLDDDSYWVRPLAMFLENVEVNGQIMPRFKYLRATNE
ncbi:MAG: DUF1653 domain-containing protein [Patescibacteria group bacterium]|jgi:hypothetical protein